MTLTELVDWIDDAMLRLPTRAAGVKHVRRIRSILEDAAVAPPNEWHKLAKKVAKLLHEPPPEKPSRTTWKPARTRKRLEKPKPQPIEINAQLQAAFDAVAAGKPIVFVTGGAGTGKSTFIRELRTRFESKSSIVLAPTGVAALNAGGQTIHSFCRLPLRPVMPDDVKKAKDPDVVKALEMVVIDEISMVRADVLDGVDAFLRSNRKSDLPFGGVQMILVGDLFQLPPVVTERDRDVIESRYPSPHFFSARCLQGLRFFPIELEIVYRQRDATFAEMLACIRDGVESAGAVRRLNELCVGRPLREQHLILAPTRQAAGRINDDRLAALNGAPRSYTAVRSGTFVNATDDRLPAPPELILKRGAQVMFVRNDSVQRWVNGTLGVVTSLEDGAIEVRLEDGSIEKVETVEWQDVEYAIDEKTKKIVEEIAGTYEQFPLMPAWAVTIHKAQGLTLSSVMVDLDRGAFAEGQVYVALSRCQTIEGLSLRRAVRTWEVRCSEAAKAFYARMKRRQVNAPLLQ